MVRIYVCLHWRRAYRQKDGHNLVTQSMATIWSQDLAIDPGRRQCVENAAPVQERPGSQPGTQPGAQPGAQAPDSLVVIQLRGVLFHH